MRRRDKEKSAEQKSAVSCRPNPVLTSQRLILFGFDFPGYNRNKRSIFNFNLPYGQKFFN